MLELQVITEDKLIGKEVPNNMKKQSVKEVCSKLAKNVAVKVAEIYANEACPFITYQPKMSKEVKKLRKF